MIYRPTGVSCAGPFDEYEEAVKARDEILVKWPEAKGLLDIDTPPYP